MKGWHLFGRGAFRKQCCHCVLIFLFWNYTSRNHYKSVFHLCPPPCCNGKHNIFHFLPGLLEVRLITNTWLSGSSPSIFLHYVTRYVYFTSGVEVLSDQRDVIQVFGPCLLCGFSSHSSLRLCDVISCVWTATKITLDSPRTSAVVSVAKQSKCPSVLWFIGDKLMWASFIMAIWDVLSH